MCLNLRDGHYSLWGRRRFITVCINSTMFPTWHVPAPSNTQTLTNLKPNNLLVFSLITHTILLFVNY